MLVNQMESIEINGNIKHCAKSVRIRYAFSRIRTGYSVQMWENTDQNNSEYGNFLSSVNEM